MTMPRRDFLRSLVAGVPLLGLSWDAFPRAENTDSRPDEYDALIIGAGLGGLSCAAAFARQGFRPLVVEQHSAPGGYATTFSRPGGFVFDVSLHSTTVGERDGVHNLIPGFPEIRDVEFVPHPNLYRAIYPKHDLRVPQRDVASYVKLLQGLFPDEKEGIAALLEAMAGYVRDVRQLQSGGEPDMSRFPVDFPHLFKYHDKTWEQMMGAHITGRELKAVISTQWGYYGLPPSRLASIYYALPLLGYLQGGGFYPVGKSQKISDAFVHFIEGAGGRVLLRTRIDTILVEDGTAVGVRTTDGAEYHGRAIVSNANAHDTFHGMLGGGEHLEDYLTRMETFTASLSSFQVWLGLKRDLIAQVGIEDSEIFFETGYDPEAGYRAALDANVEDGGFGLILYDNVYAGYSPEGKNTLNIIALQGYEPWRRYETDYFAGRKDAYRREKDRITDILIERVEKTLLPGLRDAIEIREAATPLTNVRYTSNYRGAIYGWDQTLDNSMPNRVGHRTPVKNLYLAGAWTQPGGGYGAVIPSGLQCFATIMKDWQSSSA